MRIVTRLFLAILLLGGLSNSVVHAEVAYTLTDLGNKLPNNVTCLFFNTIQHGIDPSRDNDFVYFGLDFKNNVAFEIGAFGGVNHSERGAYSINRNKQVVGSMSLDPTVPHKFVFSLGEMKDVAAPNAKTGHTAERVDSRRLDTFAFLYSDGVMQDLNKLIPPNSGSTLTRGVAINERGQILAEDATPGKRKRVCLLTPNFKMDSNP